MNANMYHVVRLYVCMPCKHPLPPMSNVKVLNVGVKAVTSAYSYITTTPVNLLDLYDISSITPHHAHLNRQARGTTLRSPSYHHHDPPELCIVLVPDLMDTMKNPNLDFQRSSDSEA